MKKINDFRKESFEYVDSWRGGVIRVAHFMGKCVGCGIRTYAFEDGENDPRGFLGDHASDPLVATDYGYAGKDVPLCFSCGNDTEAKYKRGLLYAMKKWNAPDIDQHRINCEYVECVVKGY